MTNRFRWTAKSIANLYWILSVICLIPLILIYFSWMGLFLTAAWAGIQLYQMYKRKWVEAAAAVYLPSLLIQDLIAFLILYGCRNLELLKNWSFEFRIPLEPSPLYLLLSAAVVLIVIRRKVKNEVLSFLSSELLMIWVLLTASETLQIPAVPLIIVLSFWNLNWNFIWKASALLPVVSNRRNYASFLVPFGLLFLFLVYPAILTDWMSSSWNFLYGLFTSTVFSWWTCLTLCLVLLFLASSIDIQFRVSDSANKQNRVWNTNEQTVQTVKDKTERVYPVFPLTVQNFFLYEMAAMIVLIKVCTTFYFTGCAAAFFIVILYLIKTLDKNNICKVPLYNLFSGNIPGVPGIAAFNENLNMVRIGCSFIILILIMIMISYGFIVPAIILGLLFVQLKKVFADIKSQNSDYRQFYSGNFAASNANTAANSQIKNNTNTGNNPSNKRTVKLSSSCYTIPVLFMLLGGTLLYQLNWSFQSFILILITCIGALFSLFVLSNTQILTYKDYRSTQRAKVLIQILMALFICLLISPAFIITSKNKVMLPSQVLAVQTELNKSESDSNTAENDKNSTDNTDIKDPFSQFMQDGKALYYELNIKMSDRLIQKDLDNTKSAQETQASKSETDQTTPTASEISIQPLFQMDKPIMDNPASLKSEINNQKSSSYEHWYVLYPLSSIYKISADIIDNQAADDQSSLPFNLMNTQSEGETRIYQFLPSWIFIH